MLSFVTENKPLLVGIVVLGLALVAAAFFYFRGAAQAAKQANEAAAASEQQFAAQQQEQGQEQDQGQEEDAPVPSAEEHQHAE
jgi:hypothetical protein